MKVKSKRTHAPPSCTLQSAIIIKTENLNHWEGWHTWLAMANTRVSGTSKSSDIWEIPFYEGLAKRSEERENVMEEARGFHKAIMDHITPITVLISGNGSNFQAVIDAIHAGELPAKIVRVISNRRDAYGLERAKYASIPSHYHNLIKYKKQHPATETGVQQAREEYDKELARLILEDSPELVTDCLFDFGPERMPRRAGNQVSIGTTFGIYTLIEIAPLYV
ncbi:phosphoribosylglycinamide formyltransferase [Histoplasma capsulatum H143]|uniref:phosphoribosylglycinamide formyltransferase 1 n=1 Tax=Ajellomyces capsulatus (strain H143) TaxID=544712 RepID=C6HAD0_AJECH|nr:phosphoribosylglycinamide formyltransferase [Histoplasma capsulatum H143]